jgi:hypothetical protein
MKASTYQAYISAGIMEPYEARFLEFGDSLDKIPVPKGLELPPVEPAPEDKPQEEPEGTDDDDQSENMESDDNGKEKKPAMKK